MISWQGQTLYLDVSPDIRVLAFTAGAAMLTAILFGLAPAVKATGSATAEAMKQTAHSLTERRGGWSLARLLVVAQIALSLLLLVGAGLFAGTLRNLSPQNMGFHSEGILLVAPDLRPVRANYHPNAPSWRPMNCWRACARFPGCKLPAVLLSRPLVGAHGNGISRWTRPAE